MRVDAPTRRIATGVRAPEPQLPPSAASPGGRWDYRLGGRDPGVRRQVPALPTSSLSNRLLPMRDSQLPPLVDGG